MDNIKIISTNRRANHDYFLSDFLEAGIALKGTEIKSLRHNNVSIKESYVFLKNNEAYIINMNIPIYEKGTIFNHEPKRDRKLLLHKSEIYRLQSKIKEKGYTIIPTKVYLKKGKAKVEIALAKGKKLYDKRETIKKNESKKEIDKLMKEKNNEKR